MRKGLSLIALVASLVVMFIMATTIVVSYNNINIDTKKKEFAKELFLVDQLINEYYLLNNKYPVKEKIYVDLNTIDVNSRSEFDNELGSDTNTMYLREVDLEKSNISNVVRGTKKFGESDIYVFSVETENVYYLKGEKIGDKTYYNVTDELSSLININEIN